MTLPFSSMQALEAVSNPNGLETANVLVCLFCAQTRDGDAQNHKPFFFNVFVKQRVFGTAATLCCHALPQSVAAAQLSVRPVSWCV